MIWRDYARQLQGVLALEGSPVGVAFSDVPAKNGKKTKVMACAAFYQAARKGTTFNITAESCSCPGGQTFLGLAAPNPEQAARVKKFLIEGEKFSVRSIVESIPLCTAGTAEPGMGLNEVMIK